ncbi:MAG: PAS domain S-box protein [Alphaproteobacteria bacterium]|nr:PAS domain S-box protein [Alphaproteobacteria bacterium]
MTKAASKSDKLRDASRDVPYRAIANYTYDWETWIGPDNAVRWINPAVERITGYSAAECLAMPDYPLSIIYEKDRLAMAQHLASAERGGSGNHEEFRIRRKDGELRWGAVSWQPIEDENGAADGYRTSVRDITDTKHIETELREAYREAEKADRAKTRFLAAASHDLRQPLQAISMFAGALKASLDDGNSRDLVARIQECVGGANELLEALLDVSRLDAGVLTPRPSDFIACDLMERIELEFTAQAKKKRLAMRSVPSTVIVHTDQALLHRIVGNLVANAIRYTDQGRILLGCRLRGQFLRFEVWDTGPGIEPDLREQIFEEFFQVGNPERDRQRGLGLGLAIVRRFAALLRLSVTLDSRPGKGSVFRVDVPLAASQDYLAQPEPVKTADKATLAGRTIMVVDDDPVQVDALSSLLAGWGCKVMAANDVAGARKALAGGKVPDAILADYRLRMGETGAEAVSVVRRAAGADIPGIIVTGDTEPARLAKAAGSGMVLLAKPVDADELLAVLAGNLAPETAPHPPE